MINTLAEFVTQPFVFFTLLTIQAVLVSMLVWAILHYRDVVEWEKDLFRKKRAEARRTDKVDYEWLSDMADVEEMIRICEEV